MLKELIKGQVLYRAPGYQRFATDDSALDLMEWESEELCRLAFTLHQVLRRHALGTNCVERFGDRHLAVQRMDLVGLTAVAEYTHCDAAVKFIGSQGTEFSKEEAQAIPGVTPTRIDLMEDAALQAARTLRVYLAPPEGGAATLRLAFGLCADGECLLQVINPKECDFGTTDYGEIQSRLSEHVPHKGDKAAACHE